MTHKGQSPCLHVKTAVRYHLLSPILSVIQLVSLDIILNNNGPFLKKKTLRVIKALKVPYNNDRVAQSVNCGTNNYVIMSIKLLKVTLFCY